MTDDNQPWSCLADRFASEIFRAPNTIFDMDHTSRSMEASRSIIRTLKRLHCSPWSDSLALAAGVCAVRGYSVSHIIGAVHSVDEGFRESAWGAGADDEWSPHDALRVYLDSCPFLRRSWQNRTKFLGDYMQFGYELYHWHQGVPKQAQATYASFLTPFTCLDLSGLTGALAVDTLHKPFKVNSESEG
jgi:hypothetical protein